MASITKTCRISGKQFEVSDSDQDFYRMIGVPLPTLCPMERQRRRMSFRNERNLYHRKCDFTGRAIISNISPDKPFKVYEKEIWWSDQWDPLQFGRPYDFSKSFFEQFRELQLAVPRINLFSKGGENVAYTNHATYNKNCYMLFNADSCEDCHYSTNYVLTCKSCTDCYWIDHCELLYNSFVCERCYRSTDLVDSKNCSESAFLYDCRNCEKCTLCWGLRNKKYCIENRQYSKEEYKKIVQQQFDFGSYATYTKTQERFRNLVRDNAVHRFAIIDQSENCTGDYIFESKNTFDSYYSIACRDSRFIYDGMGHVDSYDCYESAFETERQYECYACNRLKFSYFCHVSQESYNLFYTDYCFNSHDLFGCIGLKRNEYCILNKQYSKEEYEGLVPRIINHMFDRTMRAHSASAKRAKNLALPVLSEVELINKAYGEFLPSQYSPFAYNESVAQDFLPLTREEVLERGLAWREKQGEQVAPAEQKYLLPDHIRDVSDDVCDAVLACESSGKYYKIIPQELAFYRAMNLPVPRKCFDQRHKERLYWRNPRELWKRQCMCDQSDHDQHAGGICPVFFQTSYSPERPEKIYCDRCYQKTIY